MALGPVHANVRAVAEYLAKKYDISSMIGVALRANESDHPTGYAVDFMVGYGHAQETAKGSALAADARTNAGPMTIKYVIWQQHIWNFSATGAPENDHDMEDRGSITANHRDHVHISFYPGTAHLTGLSSPPSDTISGGGTGGSLMDLVKSCPGILTGMFAASIGSVAAMWEFLFHK